MKEKDILKELVSIEHYGDELSANEIMNAVEEMLSSSMQTSRRVKNSQNKDEKHRNNVGNLLIGLNCDLENVDDAVVLSGHLDTVEPAQGQKLREENGRIYGRGTVDMRSFVASVIAKAPQLQDAKVPVILALTCDEETNTFGARALTTYMKENSINTNLIIVGEPSENKIAYNHRGIIKKDIDTYFPREGHVGDGKYNAIDGNLDMIDFIRGFRNDNIKIHLGKIEGGEALNIVAAHCKSALQLRYHEPDFLPKFEATLEKFTAELAQEHEGLRIEQRTTDLYPAFAGNKENAYKVAQIIGAQVVDAVRPGFLESGFYQELTKNAVVFGPGDRGLCHTDNEHIEEAQVTDYSKKLTRLISHQRPQPEIEQ